jgi:hypothetical protein
MATLYPPPCLPNAVVGDCCYAKRLLAANEFLPARSCLQTNHNIAKTQSSIELGTYSQPLPYYPTFPLFFVDELLQYRAVGIPATVFGVPSPCAFSLLALVIRLSNDVLLFSLVSRSRLTLRVSCIHCHLSTT